MYFIFYFIWGLFTIDFKMKCLRNVMCFFLWSSEQSEGKIIMFLFTESGRYSKMETFYSYKPFL